MIGFHIAEASGACHTHTKLSIVSKGFIETLKLRLGTKTVFDRFAYLIQARCDWHVFITARKSIKLFDEGGLVFAEDEITKFK